MGHETPYSPMHEPRKHVSFEQMQAILKKHAPQACEAELFKAVQSPQVPKAPEEIAPQVQSSLRWRKLTDDSYESNKGPVLLSAAGKFIVFDRKSENGHTAQVIGRFPDRQTALDFVRLLP